MSTQARFRDIMPGRESCMEVGKCLSREIVAAYHLNRKLAILPDVKEPSVWRTELIGSSSGLTSGGVCGYPRANWYIWLVMLLLLRVERGVVCEAGPGFGRRGEDVGTVGELQNQWLGP